MSSERPKRGITRNQIDRFIIAAAARQLSIDEIVKEYVAHEKKLIKIMSDPNDKTLESLLNEIEKKNKNKP